MTDLATSRLGIRAERLCRAVSGVQARVAPLFPGGEILDTGHALWTVSTTPLLFVNGVIRYDARDFHGAASERELDSCLAVLSTYDVPWRFSAWHHLGAEVLMPRLLDRGITGTGSATAMWLDLPAGVLPGGVVPAVSEDAIEIRWATNASEHYAWTQIFIDVFGIPSEYSDVFEQMVAKSHSRSLVAYVNGRPVGCLSMAVERGLGVLYNFGVLASARRRGVGRRLLEAAHEGGAARGAYACVVVATEAGAGVCTRLGYHGVTKVSYLVPACSSSGAGRQP
jgi:GNAT superfamily N-acetyltransferase